MLGGSRTWISSDVDGVAGVAGVGASIRTFCLAPQLLVDHQLHPVAEFVCSDGVPLAVAEALSLGRVLRRDSPGSIVNMEEQLKAGEGTWKQ